MKISPRGEIEKEKRDVQKFKKMQAGMSCYGRCVCMTVLLTVLFICLKLTVVLCICLKMMAMEHIYRGHQLILAVFLWKIHITTTVCDLVTYQLILAVCCLKCNQNKYMSEHNVL